jgi:ABC-type glycerol-3-phosphate transport system permease component
MKINGWKIATVIAFILLTIWTLIPIYYSFITAFKSRIEITYWPPTLIPKEFTPQYWFIIWFDRPTIAYYRNTIIASLISTLIALAFSMPTAYTCARFNFKNRSDVLFTILTFRFLPPAAVVLPIYVFLRQLALIDTPISLGFIYGAINIPIGVWVLRSYIIEIPPELEESYMIDGHSRLRAFLDITLPLIRPGLVAVSLIILALSWGEFLFASILTTSPAGKTLPVGISEYMGGEWGYEWNKIMAATFYAIIPIIIAFIAIRKHLARGLTFGIVR